MAWTLCLVPVLGTGSATTDARRPKYVTAGIKWGGTDYGFEPWMLIAADLTPAQVTSLQAQADAMVLPSTLDALLTAGQVTTVQTTLEALPVPAEWVTTALTWRTVIRAVLGMFRFMAVFARRFFQMTGTTTPVFTTGVDLTRTFLSLPGPVRQTLSDTADELRLDRTGVISTTTLRQLLKSIGLQMAQRPLAIGEMGV
jgi:hypothetical protein